MRMGLALCLQLEEMLRGDLRGEMIALYVSSSIFTSTWAKLLFTYLGRGAGYAFAGVNRGGHMDPGFQRDTQLLSPR